MTEIGGLVLAILATKVTIAACRFVLETELGAFPSRAMDVT